MKTNNSKTNNSKTGIIKQMREIRDNLSIEIMDMTFEQEKEYIKSQLIALKAKKTRYTKLPL